MAAPLSKEIKTKIIEYLTTQDLSDLSGRKIVQLIETNVGVRISQPTALTLKYEAEDEFAEEMSIERPPIGFDRLRDHVGNSLAMRASIYYMKWLGWVQIVRN